MFNSTFENGSQKLYKFVMTKPELAYYKDGKPLAAAFKRVNTVNDPKLDDDK